MGCGRRAELPTAARTRPPPPEAVERPGRTLSNYGLSPTGPPPPPGKQSSCDSGSQSETAAPAAFRLPTRARVFAECV